MQEVKDEGIKPDLYWNAPEIPPSFWEDAVQTVLATIDANLIEFGDCFPAPSSSKGLYPAIGNAEWTSSFWTGMVWLAYEMTGCPKYREAAESQLNSFVLRIEERIEIATHDLGFLYSLSCVAGYKLTGNREARQTAMIAADHLISRYFPKANIIQAWGDLTDPQQRGRMIIDCLMNLPLLYWVSKETGNRRYHDVAYRHASQSAKFLVRNDASTYHTFYMDIESGAPLHGKTCQGFSDNSCWARGQAWGIYGFTLNYRYSGDSYFLKLAQKLANYFLNRLPDDGVCYWDLIFTDGDEERDTSAAAIAVCGLLELSNNLAADNPSKPLYRNAALQILESLTRKYLIKEIIPSGGLLRHAVYNKPSGVGVDECCIWGDYFFFEALMRLSREWKMYW